MQSCQIRASGSKAQKLAIRLEPLLLTHLLNISIFFYYLAYLLICYILSLCYPWFYCCFALLGVRILKVLSVVMLSDFYIDGYNVINTIIIFFYISKRLSLIFMSRESRTALRAWDSRPLLTLVCAFSIWQLWL